MTVVVLLIVMEVRFGVRRLEEEGENIYLPRKTASAVAYKRPGCGGCVRPRSVYIHTHTHS